MLDFNVIKNIRNDALDSIQKDSDDEKIVGFWRKLTFYSMFYIVPLALGGLSLWKNISVSDLESYITTGIAIFTGLFFSLLLSIGSKIKAEQLNPNKDKDNFKSFKIGMTQIAKITLYNIILGILIFLLILLNHILKTDCYQYIEMGFTFVVMYLLGQFIVTLFFMLQRLYFLITDELNNIL
ncbi:hypothetical protein VOI54_05370 [Tamlana sp. 2201CG12-4]|uniref:hypothetical protein n=1 Tax=Tamlana sp. 2201CG12-4 TaxID=3112582 RepID=UPI002DBD6402|nr:hypothetical protein [Tamlana sp. 2201CG12-4]MEC3906437.1 hypothetical protein [Tamlana sp. 2201CG12-4]